MEKHARTHTHTHTHTQHTTHTHARARARILIKEVAFWLWPRTCSAITVSFEFLSFFFCPAFLWLTLWPGTLKYFHGAEFLPNRFFFYRFEFERNEHVITTSSQTALDKWTLTLTSSVVLKSVCSRQSTRKSVRKKVLNNVRLLCLGASGSDKYMIN